MDSDLLRRFHDQIALEFASAFAYLQMAAWCEAHDLVGFATWMRAQANEETQHALKFFDFVLDRGAEVELQGLQAPRVGFTSPLEVLEASLAHERSVTTAIGQLYEHASRVADFASLPLLQWFLNEQVEEEASVRQIVAELRMIGDDSSALLLLDRELPGRRERAGTASSS